MKPKKFRVYLSHPTNRLAAMVEVFSPTIESAGRFAKRQFFPGSGWQVDKVESVNDGRQ